MPPVPEARCGQHEQGVTNLELGIAQFAQNSLIGTMNCQHRSLVTLPESNVAQRTADENRTRAHHGFEKRHPARRDPSSGRGSRDETGSVLQIGRFLRVPHEPQGVLAFEQEFGSDCADDFVSPLHLNEEDAIEVPEPSLLDRQAIHRTFGNDRHLDHVLAGVIDVVS